MGVEQIRLVGANRYTRGGRMFEAGKVYTVKDHVAVALLEQTDTFNGLPYFERVKPMSVEEKQRKAAAAARMAERREMERLEEENAQQVDYTEEPPELQADDRGATTEEIEVLAEEGTDEHDDQEEGVAFE